MSTTIMEHYLNRCDTVQSVSDFSKAVCRLLGVTVDTRDVDSVKAFFEAYDTQKVSEMEYLRAMSYVSFYPGKPTYDPLESFRPAETETETQD